jgi:hypothetical protein
VPTAWLFAAAQAAKVTLAAKTPAIRGFIDFMRIPTFAFDRSCGLSFFRDKR